MQFGAPQQPKTVPLIREELRLLSAANNTDGSPAWMLQDPINNKFYRIGWLDFEMLSRWELHLIDDIVQGVNNETTLDIDDQNVLNLVSFLNIHRLLQANTAAAVDQLINEAGRNKKAFLTQLVHHYLFFRIPLIKPQVLLAKCLPYLRWVFSPVTAFTVLMITLTGLFLVTRQWDTFKSTFVDQLSLSGAISFGVALVFSKCLHELGHAFTATRYNVRVAHMGIALLVMFPMPYTDTSESWKLTNPKQRLNIASAGIITELALAGIATLAWSLSADGAFKSALFFLATTSWVLTLLINVSPFMRFDGYFILSDLLDFPNLHERSTAIAKTWMRRTLLGFKEDYVEEFSTNKRRALTIFATITWLYRLTVFIGIAWLVYYFFFKVLGIILFVIELAWFVFLPIWKELTIWFVRRSEIKPSRILIGLLLIISLLILGLMPWQTSVRGHAWVHATQQTVIFTPTAGKLASLAKNGPVVIGQGLFSLSSPDIANDALRAQGLSDAREMEMRGLSGIENGEEQRAQLQSQQDKFNAEVKLYEDELSRMDLVAPFTGVLQDIDESLSVGTWVHPKQAMAVLINPQTWAADALVEEAQINRVQVGNKVKITIHNGSYHVFNGQVQEIDTTKVSTLPHNMLDVQHGGEIATLPNDKSVPVLGFYKVRIKFDQQPNLQKMTLANVSITTEAKAWLPNVFNRLAALFVRESGF